LITEVPIIKARFKGLQQDSLANKLKDLGWAIFDIKPLNALTETVRCMLSLKGLSLDAFHGHQISC